MINAKDFKKLNKEVVDSVTEAFDYARRICRDDRYILFLADGEYKERYRNSSIRINPYTIDNQEDYWKDRDRLDFLEKFLNTFYTFNNGKTSDNHYTMTMELMIYTHIWESKTFLKQLYRLSELVNGRDYHWSVIVPEMSKHKFIRFKIRDSFKSKKLKIATVMTKGFHTSLRNAFAHSEYQFDDHFSSIHLDTFKGASWDISSLSYDEWTKRFAYSALLSYYFFNIRTEKRKSLVADFGKTEFEIIHPITDRKFRVNKITYVSAVDRFVFSKNLRPNFFTSQEE